MIAGYLGSSDQFDEAIGDYAVAYADQVERDYKTLVQAVRSGRLKTDLSPVVSRPHCDSANPVSGMEGVDEDSWSVGALLMVLWTISPGVGFAQAQTTLSAEEKLEQEFTDPLSTLPQLLVRDSYTPANYGPCTPQVLCFRNVETNQLIIRPLIPRIPANSLLPFTQLVRPTFALVTVPSSRGGTRTEFGDLPMFDIAVLPWPDRQKTGLLIGVGPTFRIPDRDFQKRWSGCVAGRPCLRRVSTQAFPGC